MKKKKKEQFKEFRNNEKSAYKTFKIPLKTILLNCDTIQPLHRPERKMRQNAVMICIFYNYVLSNLLNVLS